MQIFYTQSTWKIVCLFGLMLLIMVAPAHAGRDDYVEPSNTENEEAIVPHQQTPNDSWPQVQYDANRSGYVPQTVGPPYTELWRLQALPPISSRVQPIIAEDKIFMPSNDNGLYAYSTANGAQEWRFNTDGPLVNSAGYANGKVFFGSTDRHIYAVNAADGSLAWRYATGSTIRTAPLLADGKLFIGSSDGHMYALNQADGSLLWRYHVGAPIYDTAAYDNGKLFFGGMDSVGYALNAADGSLAWDVEIPGQGFRDRWTVAGHGKVFFTPMLATDHHRPLAAGTFLFKTDSNPVIYNKSWDVQKQTILAHLAERPYYQPLHVINQDSGQAAFTPPVLYASGGSMSPHSQPVLLPNGNANVIYRRSFGFPARYGQTTNDALYTGELVLSNGDIQPVDRCVKGQGGWEDCGDYKSAIIADESVALMRTGNLIYLDDARGTMTLDTRNETSAIMTVYNNTSGTYVDAPIVFYPQHEEWILSHDFENVLSEVPSDGNDLKRPTPVVDNIFYVFHYNSLVVVQGTK